MSHCTHDGYCEDVGCNVHDLDDKIYKLEHRLAEVLAQRDDIMSELHREREATRAMKTAASSAAGTAVSAIERIQELMLIVDAAVKWRAAYASETAPAAETLRYAAKLRDQVDEHLRRVARRS